MDAFRAPAIIAGFLLLTFVCVPPQWLARKLNLEWRKKIPKFYHRTLCRMMGIRTHVIGEPIKGGGLLLANHSSWLDIIILSGIFPLAFVAKSEVNTWPLFGLLARLQNTIFVHRGDRTRALGDRDSIRARIKAGDMIMIFPEGTSSDGNRVLSFKSALLSAAEPPIGEEGKHANDTRVQPVSLGYVARYGIPMGRETRPSYAWYGDMDLVSHLWEAFASGPIDVVVEFHKPLSASAAGGRKQLAEQAERAVREGLLRALNDGRHHFTKFGYSTSKIVAIGEEGQAAAR